MDLRQEPVDHVLDQVEQRLGTALVRTGVVCKRRTVGVRTDRSSWVRVERRPWVRAREQGWGGVEAAVVLAGVAMPRWFGSVTWQDPHDRAIWQADETSLLPGQPVGGAVVAADPELPDTWWRSLNASLDALAAQWTARVATPDTEQITQKLIDDTIGAAFPEVQDTRVERWCPAHADLNWANVTGPGEFCMFDWEDWGMAPYGLDSASLYAASLAVPALADRVRTERQADLESRDGTVMQLFVLAKIVGPYTDPEDPRAGPARREAVQLIRALQSG
ncbi:aminoglycoside phosphotransferase family protein [Kitasatospora sp. NBC_01246]|uniref:hypothetical protein n=1 Tax=Kitasatospora sp. NBC_01246 TaxID=2903570 RepID=UPI002E34CD50|nr:hypothetical protein [Kitasatospora sp. NBC_01246]